MWHSKIFSGLGRIGSYSFGLVLGLSLLYKDSFQLCPDKRKFSFLTSLFAHHIFWTSQINELTIGYLVVCKCRTLKTIFNVFYVYDNLAQDFLPLFGVFPLNSAR